MTRPVVELHVCRYCAVQVGHDDGHIDPQCPKCGRSRVDGEFWAFVHSSNWRRANDRVHEALVRHLQGDRTDGD